jgi:probable rRNA maturation factor
LTSPVYTVDVASTCTGWSQACPGAERHARRVAHRALEHAAPAALRQARLEVAIVLADASLQRGLNRDYRGVDTPTNVLAFPAWEPGTRVPIGAPVLLGDVVLALEIVAREASEQNKPIADHLRHLVVHGVLHLLGYDHMTPTEALMMEELERSILADLGVSDPYRDPMCSLEPEFTSHE